MAEAEVDGIPLPAEIWHGGDEWGDALYDPFHFLLRARDEAGGLAFYLDVLGAGVFFNFFADGGEGLFCLFKEFMDVFLAAVVPWLVGEKASEGVWEIDFPLAGDDPVWDEGEMALDEAVKDLGHGAASIDAPDGVSRVTEAADGLEKLGGYGWGFCGVVQGAIEVEGEDHFGFWAGIQRSHGGQATGKWAMGKGGRLCGG